MSKSKMDFSVALSLALAVLTSWEEDDRREPGRKIRRAWKGHLFEILDNLEQRGFIRHAGGTRSMQITPEGEVVGSRIIRAIKTGFESLEDRDLER